MRKGPHLNRQVQLDLYCQRPSTPQWDRLPTEVRHKTLRLLARLLSYHHRGTDANPCDKEAADE